MTNAPGGNPATVGTGEAPARNNDDDNETASIAGTTASATASECHSSCGDHNNNNNNGNRPGFSEGDHVYRWCSFLGVPAVFAHHGIVVKVAREEDSGEWFLWVADFDNRSRGETDENNEPGQGIFRSGSSSWPKGSSAAAEGFGSHPENNLRVCKTPPAGWEKVRYGVGFWQEHLSRGGTVTGAESDPPGLVLARVRFLLGLPPDQIPPYDALKSNCECIAVWCKCGRFASLQGAQFLGGMVATQAKSTAAVAGVAATTQVTVPAAGVWGWFGYTTQVGLLSAQPWLLPALVAGGAVAVGGPAIVLALAKGHWRSTTERLHEGFWEDSADRPDLLVDLIQHYRDQGYHERVVCHEDNDNNEDDPGDDDDSNHPNEHGIDNDGTIPVSQEIGA